MSDSDAGGKQLDLDEGQHAWKCPEGHIRVSHESNLPPSKSPHYMCCGGCTPDDGDPANREFRYFEVVADE